jgi:NAD(P)-dependent dehydrogenase (short-subunit alcohol dehydrogenase family)
MAQSPVVIVTGGVAGIGAAIVDRLLRENARILVIDLVEEPLKQRQATVGGDRFQYVVGDVSNDEINSKAVDIAIGTWGVIDAVALNAGIMSPIQRICDMRSTDVTRIFNINVVAHISMVGYCARRAT